MNGNIIKVIQCIYFFWILWKGHVDSVSFYPNLIRLLAKSASQMNERITMEIFFLWIEPNRIQLNGAELN